MPPDVELDLLSRTVGRNRMIDEFVPHCTHTVQMNWFAPGIAPTGRRLQVPHVGIVAFEDGRIASEHVYWDHATVLRQLGVLGEDLPALGADQAGRLLNPDAPANELIMKFGQWAVPAPPRLPAQLDGSRRNS